MKRSEFSLKPGPPTTSNPAAQPKLTTEDSLSIYHLYPVLTILLRPYLNISELPRSPRTEIRGAECGADARETVTVARVGFPPPILLSQNVLIKPYPSWRRVRATLFRHGLVSGIGGTRMTKTATNSSRYSNTDG